MEGSHGSGTVRTLSLIVLTLALVAMITLSCGSHPQGNGITWDNTVAVEQEQTKRHEITEDNQTERERINADERTSTQWAITLRWLGVAAAAGVGVWAWSRRPHRPVPQQVIALLPSFPGHIAEFSPVEREWTIVEPTTGEYYTVTDARRLLEMRNEF